MSKLTYLVIHCTATTAVMSIDADTIKRMHMGPANLEGGKVLYMGKTYGSREVLPDEVVGGKPIKTLVGRGWKKVGYSDLIDLTGKLINLTPYDADDDVEGFEITNGVAGKNSISRHVVYAGGLSSDRKTPTDTRNPKQKLTLENYVKQVVAQHPHIKICGHNQLDGGKLCPSFYVPTWLRSIGIPEENIHNDAPANIKKYFKV